MLYIIDETLVRIRAKFDGFSPSLVSGATAPADAHLLARVNSISANLYLLPASLSRPVAQRLSPPQSLSRLCALVALYQIDPYMIRNKESNEAYPGSALKWKSSWLRSGRAKAEALPFRLSHRADIHLYSTARTYIIQDLSARL